MVGFDSAAAGRSEQTGLLVASAVVPGTFAGSLSRRSWVDQGVITGFTTGLTYLLTLLTHDGIEVLASRLAPALPLGSDATSALTASAEPFCSRPVCPAGIAVQRAIARRPGERTVRGLARQAAWRTTLTGIGGSALAAAQTVTTLLDERLGAGGRLARFPVAVPTGLAIAQAVEWQRLRGQEPEPGREDEALMSRAFARGRKRCCRYHFLDSQPVSDSSLGPRDLPWPVRCRGPNASAPGRPRRNPRRPRWGYRLLYGRAIAKIEAGTTAVDPVLKELVTKYPIGSTISGSTDSLVSWESIGREGRRHGFAGVRPEPVHDRPPGVPDLSIPTVMGEPARDQCRFTWGSTTGQPSPNAWTSPWPRWIEPAPGIAR